MDRHGRRLAELANSVRLGVKSHLVAKACALATPQHILNI